MPAEPMPEARFRAALNLLSDLAQAGELPTPPPPRLPPWDNEETTIALAARELDHRVYDFQELASDAVALWQQLEALIEREGS